MLGAVAMTVSLRRCFYLSAMVFVLSTLMAMVIIIKLSPLESIKCPQQKLTTTPTIEWSNANTISSNSLINNQQDVIDFDKNKIQNKISRLSWKMRNRVLPLFGKNNNDTLIDINYNIHVFYYAWYRSMSHDGIWKHWNHQYLPNWKKNDKRRFPEGTHRPPADIGANYYPALGCYSSLDPMVN